MGVGLDADAHTDGSGHVTNHSDANVITIGDTYRDAHRNARRDPHRNAHRDAHRNAHSDAHSVAHRDARAAAANATVP